MAARVRVVLVAVLATTGVLWATAASAQVINLSTSGPSGTAFQWIGPQANARAGVTLQRADLSGDVDRRDMIVGAPGAGPAGQGQLFVVFMGPQHTGTANLSTADIILTGDTAGDSFGTAAAAGMVIRREVAPLPPRDLVVAAPSAFGGNGAVYLFPGAFHTGDRKAASAATFRIIGASGDQLGKSVAATDLDGDGYRDIVMSAPGSGRIYVVFGGPSLAGTRDLRTQTADLTIAAPAGALALATADFNVDGFSDLALGVPAANGGAGTVYVLLGRARAAFATSFPITASNAQLTGIDAGDHAGATVQNADFDGDGVQDIVVGAPDAAGPSNTRAGAGEAYVIWGGSRLGSTSRSLAAADVTIFGAAAGHHLATAMSHGQLRRAIPEEVMLLAPGASTNGDIDIVYGGPRNSRPVVDLANGVDRQLRADPAGAPIQAVAPMQVTGKGDDIIAAAPTGTGGGNASAGVLYNVYSPVLVASPASTAITVAQGATATATVNINNIGTLSIDWAGRSNTSWLSLSTATGTSTNSTPGQLRLTVSPGNLAPGVYHGGFTYVSRDGDLTWSDDAAVDMTVTAGSTGTPTPTNPFGVPDPPDEGSPNGVFTTTGTNVRVLVARDVLVTFTHVTSPGQTLVRITNRSAPDTPGVSYGPWLYQISTTATYDGPVGIGLTYDPAMVTRWDGEIRIWSDGINVTTQVDDTRHLVFGSMKNLNGTLSVVDDPRGLTIGTDGSFNYVGVGGTTGQWSIYPLKLDNDTATDFFLFNAASGQWKEAINNGEGVFRFVNGGWSPGWQVVPIDLTGDRVDDFFLYNRDTGVFYRVLNDGAGTFTYVQGGWAPGFSVYPGDLDGDGKVDLFVYNPANGVWYCVFNRGASGFEYVQGGWTGGWQLYPGDLNGDGKSDFLLYNGSSGAWYRATSNGNGTFNYISGAWAAGWTIYPGDFDGDHVTDFLLVDPQSGFWYQALTTGASFRYFSGTWSPGWRIYTADLDGNGRTDVFLHNPADGTWYKALSDGHGGFAYTLGQWSTGWSVAVGDVNGDGAQDIVLLDGSGGRWFNALSNPSATTAIGSPVMSGTREPAGTSINAGTGFLEGQWLQGLQVMSLKLQGRAANDLFAYNPQSGQWHEVFNNGARGFTYMTGGWAPGWQVLPIDLNNDGFDDLFLYNRDSGIFYKAQNDHNGGFVYTQGGWAPGWNITRADLDGDGVTDLFVYNPSSGAWTCVFNRGASGFQYVNGGWAPGWQIYAAKLNSDTATDLFLYNAQNGSWYEAFSNRNGTFNYAAGTWAPGWTVVAGDVTNDGLDDLVLYDPGSGASYQVINHTNGTFSYVYTTLLAGGTLVPADYDGDHRMDLFIYNAPSGTWAQALSTGAGFLTTASSRWAPNLSLTPADLNGDGHRDLFAYDRVSGTWFQVIAR